MDGVFVVRNGGLGSLRYMLFFGSVGIWVIIIYCMFWVIVGIWVIIICGMFWVKVGRRLWLAIGFAQSLVTADCSDLWANWCQGRYGIGHSG